MHSRGLSEFPGGGGNKLLNPEINVPELKDVDFRASTSVPIHPFRSASTRTKQHFYDRPPVRLHHPCLCDAYPDLSVKSHLGSFVSTPRVSTCSCPSSQTPRRRRTPFCRRDLRKVFEGSRSLGSRRSPVGGRSAGRWPFLRAGSRTVPQWELTVLCRQSFGI